MSEPEQRAAFIAPDDSELTRRSKKGYKKIKPEEKHVPKQKRKKLLPFDEVMQQYGIMKQRMELADDGVWEVKDGNRCIIHERHISIIGDDFDPETAQQVFMSRPHLPTVPRLSGDAYKLKIALERKQQEEGPTFAKDIPMPPPTDFLGRPIKK